MLYPSYCEKGACSLNSPQNLDSKPQHVLFDVECHSLCSHLTESLWVSTHKSPLEAFSDPPGCQLLSLCSHMLCTASNVAHTALCCQCLCERLSLTSPSDWRFLGVSGSSPGPQIHFRARHTGGLLGH